MIVRKIRSFVRREGRMTISQRAAIDNLSACYILSSKELLDFTQIFGRTAPRIIEIGFGMGYSLLTMAKQHPEQDYLGIEVHRPGVGALLAGIEKEQLSNIRICTSDAIEILEQQIEKNSIDTVQLFFPDPWPKKRHQKRRIVQAEFLEQIKRILKPGGHFLMATDCEDYAQQALALLSVTTGFKNDAGDGQFMPTPILHRPMTKFEQRGQKLGHTIRDLSFTKVGE